MFFAASDWLNANPLVLVSLVQAALLLALIGGLFVKGLTLKMPDKVLLLLVSPALVLFWVNDSTAGYRKELLGLAAFLPLLFPRTSGIVGLGVVIILFTYGVFFHEGNVVLAPALIFMLYLRQVPRLYIAIGAVITATIGATLFAARYMSLSSSDGMCQRLLDAGLQETLCGGIFNWLITGSDRTVSSVQNIVINSSEISVLVAVISILCVHLFCFWLARGMLRSRSEWVMFLISTGAVFALYPLATDWSRWLSMQVFVMTFILLLLGEKRTELSEPVPRTALTVILVLSLGVGFDNIAPTPVPGFVYTFFEAIASVAI